MIAAKNIDAGDWIASLKPATLHVIAFFGKAESVNKFSINASICQSDKSALKGEAAVLMPPTTACSMCVGEVTISEVQVVKGCENTVGFDKIRVDVATKCFVIISDFLTKKAYKKLLNFETF
ncbi:hypothetical protein J6590_055408 [Homalodisca vitripennis]|nr:hypothetical protein J6590_055408 [Homalodisca vitripennis]